jgi:predicted RNA-binding protein associated with RNAse of E/G family
MERQTTGAHVIERKVRLDGTTVEFTCDGLLVEPGRRAVLRYVTDRVRHVGALLVPYGTVTVAYYWVDRPYNVYHWIRGGRTLGYYGSVADRTTIEPHLVTYRDLAVDVLLRPSGEVEVLDEDELPTDLDPDARRTVALARETLSAEGRRLMRDIEEESRRLLP